MKISQILTDYFQDETTYRSGLKNTKGTSISLKEIALMPVSPNPCEWLVHEAPERFSREFKFQDKLLVSDFLREILLYEKSTGHSGTHRIDHLSVTVEVYTHDVNKITELDQEYINQVDKIHEDVLHFEY